jgi:phospholipid-binding lipoprotein MlaA
MKALSLSLLLAALFAAGCAHDPGASLSAAPSLQASARPAVARHEASAPAEARPPEPGSPPTPAASSPAPLPGGPGVPAAVPETAAAQKADEFGDITEFDETEAEAGGRQAEAPGIADPLEPFNRIMYHFNDKLYYWLLKPAAQGYARVVPKTARVGVDNFFQNLAFPVRFVNCLLQANFEGAARELGRFTVNTLWGVGGLLDPASSPDIDLPRQEEDFGQTLGSYGIGQGFYLHWPVFGPSSPRDTVGLVGDSFLRPFSYLDPWYVGAGASAYDRVNDTSLRIGDYEALQGAAVDPYVAIRDAYVQYRLKKVQNRGTAPPEKKAHP